MDKIKLQLDLINCGFIKLNNKWVRKNNTFALPSVYAQYINHDSEYQYSNIQKVK